MRPTRALLLAGAGAAAYALIEPSRFRLQTKYLPLPGAPSLSVLHLSDTHMKSYDRPLQKWLKGLPELLDPPPDLILATGDLIDDDSGIDPLLGSLAGLRARYGTFYVLGSHDYYQAVFRFPTKYFVRKEQPLPPERADTDRLEEGLRSAGWTALTNTTAFVDAPQGRIRIAGVDDPHIHLEQTDHIERAHDDELAIALMHAPNVTSTWILNGFDVVLAGHTHAGQVRVPFGGALVTNSTLPAALAGGLHKVGRAWLHVSPGLGVSKFTPIRFLTRPEATLLKIGPR
jgi:predicted MPP superfamily phosphohydrolase